MLKAYFYKTNGFNGLLITDGEMAISIFDFPADGTMEDAINWDFSGISGCKTLEDIEYAIGVEPNKFKFNEEEFEALEEIEMEIQKMKIRTSRYNEVAPSEIRKLVEAGGRIIKSSYMNGVPILRLKDGTIVYTDDDIEYHNIKLPLAIGDDGYFNRMIEIN